MFIGHYAPALAARALKPSLPLWQLFVAAQLVDFIWAALVAARIEDLRIVPGFMAASDLDLYFMPYSHSLVAAILWAIGAGLAFAALRSGRQNLAAGGIIGLVVLSHWLTDYLVHAPDLPLWKGGPQVGLGLWNSLVVSQLLEVGLLLAGMLLYVRSTRSRGLAGTLAPWLLFSVMLFMQAANLLLPPEPQPPLVFAGTAFASFSALALFAWLADRQRLPR
ncbi:MAG: hypothetical protein WA979_01225 [Pacificimonas sp.]